MSLATTNEHVRQPMSLRRAYLLGLMSNLTNPKIAVCFLTFLPQFITLGPHATIHVAMLGLLFNAMASRWWVVYVVAMGRISRWLTRSPIRGAIERVTGAVLIASGVRLATQR